MALAENERGNSNALLKGTYQLNMNMTCSEVIWSSLSCRAGSSWLANGIGNTRHIYITGTTNYDGTGQATTRKQGTLLFPACMRRAAWRR